MDASKMKNMIILKNLPSNLVEEAIVVLKENKKVKKYQYVDNERKKNNNNTKNENKTNSSDYIIKEAENVISQYISKLEMKTPSWKNNMKKLEKRYKQSVKLNFILGFTAILSIVVSFTI